MKDDWERVEPAPSLDRGQISEIIQPAFPDKKVSTFERLCTGLSNSNYKIVVEGYAQPFVLRLYNVGKEVAEKEMSIAKLVRKTVPIADFIHADTSCNRVDKPWAILEWKEGILLSDIMKAGSYQDVARAANSVGKVLADIHSYKFSQPGFFSEGLKVRDPLKMDGEQFLTFIKDFLDSRCGSLLGSQLKQRVWSFCQLNSPFLSDSNENPVLVHSDFNGLNILLRRGPTGLSVSGVLDWEFAVSWSRYADIGNMLRYEQDGSLFEKHFIQGYREKGAVLDDNWKLLSKLEDIVALCDLLNNSTPQTPKRIEDLRDLISRTVKWNF